MFTAIKLAAAAGNIYAGRTLWLRAQSLSLGNGQSVASWTNEGSAGGTFANVAGLPTYNTNQVNGLPAVTFQSGQALPTTRLVSDILGSGRTWALVVAARGIGDQSPDVSGPPFLGSTSDTFTCFVANGSTIYAEVAPTQATIGTFTSGAAFVFGVSNAASGSHHVFNTTASTNANLPSLSRAASQGMRIGNGSSHNFAFMGILEMMAFNKFKTAAELAAITSALRSKYAIS